MTESSLFWDLSEDNWPVLTVTGLTDDEAHEALVELRQGPSEQRGSAVIESYSNDELRIVARALAARRAWTEGRTLEEVQAVYDKTLRMLRGREEVEPQYCSEDGNYCGHAWCGPG